MARYFLNIGTDWGNTANWSDTDGGAGGFSVPTSADDVFFTALSGNCTVNASARVCKTLNFTGYTNTITMSQNITVSGNVTLVAAMTISGAGELWINAAATLTSNTKAWPNMLWIRPTTAVTVTLADNWQVGNLYLSVSAVLLTVNGNTLTTNGDCIVQSTSQYTQGTTQIIMAGTGTLATASSSFLRLPLEINTAGTITLGSFLNKGNDFIITAGTVVTTGNTLLLQNVSMNFQTNGVAFNNVTFGNITGIVVTLLDDLTVNGTLQLGTSNNNTYTINGSTLYLNGSFNVPVSNSSITGTTNFIYSGTTGTWTSLGGAIRNNLTINTAGTLTISGTVAYNTGTLTYISGTIVTTGSTLVIGGSCTINTSGMTWATVNCNSSSQTITITSNFNVTNFTVTQAVNITGAFAVNVGGNITINNTTISTSTINLVGTGTWSGTGTLNSNLNINTAGTITVSGVVTYILQTLTYVAGTVVTTGSRLATGGNGTTTFNTNGIVWDSFSIEGSSTATLTSVLSTNNLEHRGSGNCIINGSNLQIYANITSTVIASRTLSGTSNFIYLGTGTWSSLNNSPIGNNLTINTAGTLTISGTVYYNTGTLTYTSGTVVTTSSTLYIANNITLNTSGISWNNVTITTGNIVNNSLLTISDTLALGTSGNVIFSGTSGFNTANMTCTTAGRNITLKAGLTYNVTSSLVMTGTSPSHITLLSDTASSYAYFNLNPAATQNLSYVNGTDIDSSGGQTIRTTPGMTLTRTINWAYRASSNFFFFFQ